MSKSYRFLMFGCAIATLVIGSTYAASLAMAHADGIGVGVELSHEVSVISVATLMIAVILGGGAWIVDRSAKQSAARDIRPIIRVETRAQVDEAFDERLPGFAKAVAAELAAALEPGMKRMVDAAGAKSVAAFREVCSGDLTEIINAAVGRAHRAGMVNQAIASSRTVRPIRSATLTSADD